MEGRITYKRIQDYEYLSSCINNSYLHFLSKEEEHPFALDFRYIKQDAVIGYFVYAEALMIGMVFVSPFHSKEAYSITYNFNIHIVKEYRGRGLGQAGMDILLKDIRDKSNIENLIVTVYQEQFFTMKWLIKNEFVQVGHLDWIDINDQYDKRIVFFIKRIER